ncbi:MAG: hypothetical protein IBX39_04980 [Candidatus Methanoperedenaceae archaeon]|nr:hypothetical protein [Candidatus Methanoperedenaceae archaeon]MDW7726597.1 hypothetical protein [Candidatus Methanoperedens sp.]
MSIISSYYPILSTINLVAAIFGVYYGMKLYYSTKGAIDFWLFLSAFLASLGAYTLFGFLRKALLVQYDIAFRSAQDVSIAFAAVFAVIAAIYVKKMFDRILGED